MSGGKKQEMKSSKANKVASTQKYLPIAEIKDDIVVMKDGTMRKVLMVSSINFALKNEDEQQAIINGYVQFLNTLEWPVQIIIQSRKLDIQGYIQKLRKLSKIQNNELLKIQTTEYANYIEQMVELAQIMEKKFLIVVAYSPFSNKKKTFWARVNEVLTPGRVIKLKDEKFEKYKHELERRASIAGGGLSSLGLKVVEMDTQGLIEMYYQSYNPVRGKQRNIDDLNKYRIQEK